MAPLTRRGTQPTDVLTLGFIVLFAAIPLVHAPEVAVWPWLLTMIGFLLVITFWPGLTLWFPTLMGMVN